MESDSKSAPKAERIVAQPIVAPLSRAAIFLVATLKPGTDSRATLRSPARLQPRRHWKSIFRAVRNISGIDGRRLARLCVVVRLKLPRPCYAFSSSWCGTLVTRERGL